MDITSRFGKILLLSLLLCVAAPAAATTGTIQINVHPGGGTVCLDTLCRANPGTADGVGSVTFNGVDAGQYHMLNVYGTDGYKPWLGQVFLDPSGTSLTREIVLEPLPPSAPSTGTLRVFITPDGGKVCLDRMCEVSSGDRTGSWSVQFTDISAGTSHTLTIVNEGYTTYTTQVRLQPGQISTMTVTLQPLPAGSTPSPTPPVQAVPPTPRTQPTQADLPGVLAVMAVGVCGLAWLLNRPGQD
jgi:hypothetical protein